MSPEVRRRIFDPFYSTKNAGHGLGLAAALGIARSHNGGFDVQTEAGKGSTFTLWLPRSTAELAVEPRQIAPGRRSQQPRVLVVDDQSQVREMVVTVLERCGYRAVQAAGGREAIQALVSAPEDLALAIIDMSMPDMDGEATLRALRAVRADLPVLLSSGFDAHEAANRLAGEQGVDFLPKPYRLAELQAKVEALTA
jgi:CheY-like chemotaxis protein